MKGKGAVHDYLSQSPPNSLETACNRLKVRWQWSPYLPGDSVIDCAVESRMGVYADESNEILLIKRNIGSPFKAILVLFHELLHYFIHKLRLPQKMHVINDEVWWRVFGGG